MLITDKKTEEKKRAANISRAAEKMLTRNFMGIFLSSSNSARGGFTHIYLAPTSARMQSIPKIYKEREWSKKKKSSS